MRKVILNNEHIEKLKSYLKEEKDEVTFYQFSSQLKNFLRELLSHPSNPQLSDFWKTHGFTKNKLIEYLLKIGLIEKEEKLNEEMPEEVKMDISFKIPRKDFKRKQKKMFIKFFEKNLPIKEKEQLFSKVDNEELMDEEGMAGGGGATTTGSVGTDGKNHITTPLFGVINKDIYKPKYKTKNNG